MRVQIRKDGEKIRNAFHKNQELTITKEQMLKEIIQLRKLVSGLESKDDPNMPSNYANDISDLKNQISEKDKIINQLQNPDSDEVSKVMAENRKLLRESQMWQLRATKLSQDLAKKQIDNSTQVDLKRYNALLEEVEDLRINYKNSVRQNLIYEERLKIST